MLPFLRGACGCLDVSPIYTNKLGMATETQRWRAVFPCVSCCSLCGRDIIKAAGFQIRHWVPVVGKFVVVSLCPSVLQPQAAMDLKCVRKLITAVVLRGSCVCNILICCLLSAIRGRALDKAHPSTCSASAKSPVPWRHCSTWGWEQWLPSRSSHASSMHCWLREDLIPLSFSGIPKESNPAIYLWIDPDLWSELAPTQNEGPIASGIVLYLWQKIVPVPVFYQAEGTLGGHLQ